MECAAGPRRASCNYSEPVTVMEQAWVTWRTVRQELLVWELLVGSDGTRCPSFLSPLSLSLAEAQAQERPGLPTGWQVLGLLETSEDSHCLLRIGGGGDTSPERTGVTWRSWGPKAVRDPVRVGDKRSSLSLFTVSVRRNYRLFFIHPNVVACPESPDAVLEAMTKTKSPPSGD